MLLDYRSNKKSPVDDEGAFYTSLTSDSSYFTGILKKGDCGLDDEELSFGSQSPQDMHVFQSRGLFSSDSGIEMTPAESKDVIKTLSDPMEDDKLEAYRYIDISRSPDSNLKHSPEVDEKKPRPSPMGYDFYEKERIHEGATKTFHKEQHSDKIYEDLSFAPYMEEPGNSMGLYSDTGIRNAKTSPVKITLTGSSIDNDFMETSQDLPEIGLKPGSDIVPTVMVSEPEDDSPESLTPPSIETGKTITLYTSDSILHNQCFMELYM